jgi:hypothetical protein
VWAEAAPLYADDELGGQEERHRGGRRATLLPAAI